MANIKKVSVTPFDRLDRMMEALAAAEAVVAPTSDDPLDGATVTPKLDDQQVQSLYMTLRKMRTQINELHVTLYENGLNMPIARLCTVIRANLDGYTDREATNLAETLYGPTLIEGLMPYDRVRVSKCVLGFFEHRNITAPLPYWDLIVTNNGFVK